WKRPGRLLESDHPRDFVRPRVNNDVKLVANLKGAPTGRVRITWLQAESPRTGERYLEIVICAGRCMTSREEVGRLKAHNVPADRRMRRIYSTSAEQRQYQH